jgi:phytanoyl-CoA hydroxylase
MDYQNLLSDENEQSKIRQRANAIINELKDISKKDVHNSWIKGPTKATSSYPSDNCRFFDEYGFLHVKYFSLSQEILDMKRQMQTLVDTQWDPNGEGLTVFRTDEKQIEEQGSTDYFLESANKVHFFAESGAMTQEGKLKQEFLNDKISALNKAGHGMHVQPGAFHTYTKSDKVRNLVSELGWEDPVVPQSMYIFKQARVGAEVTSHQDSTFLYTTPKQSCLGLWLALDDATITNGCLWVRPKSHREMTRTKFVKNPAHFGTEQIQERSNIAKGDLKESQMIFVDEDVPKDDAKIDWVGKIPSVEGMSPWESLFEKGFIPVECKKGDLVVFPGELDHLSLPNVSDKQRHTFQLHLVEGEKAGVTWSETNWLQYPKTDSFLRLNA